MDLDRIREVHDTGQHYLVVHEDEGTFPVAKRDLEPAHLEALDRFCRGGDLPGYDDGTPNAPIGEDVPPPVERPATAGDAAPEAPGVAPSAITTISPDGQVQVQHFVGPPQPGPIGPTSGGGAPLIPPATQPAPAPPEGVVGPAGSGPVLQEDPEARAVYQHLIDGGATPEEAARLAGPLNTPIPATPSTNQEPTLPGPVTEAAPAVQPAALPALQGAADHTGDLRKLSAQDIAGEKAVTDAKNAIAADSADLQLRAKKTLDDIGQAYQAALQANQARGDTLYQQSLKAIDPDRLFRSSPGWAQTLSLLGLGLGTFGAAWSKTPNYAFEVYKNAIENDIKTQEADRRRGVDLAQLNTQQRQHLLEEHNVAVADSMKVLQANLERSAAQHGQQLNDGLRQQFNAHTTAAYQAQALQQAKAKNEAAASDIALRQQQLGQQFAELRQRVLTGALSGAAKPGSVEAAGAQLTPIEIAADPEKRLKFGLFFPTAHTSKNGETVFEYRPRYVTSESGKTELEDAGAALFRTQRNLSALQGIMRAHPAEYQVAGTDANAQANALISTLGTEAPLAISGLKRINGIEVDKNLEQLGADNTLRRFLNEPALVATFQRRVSDALQGLDKGKLYPEIGSR